MKNSSRFTICKLLLLLGAAAMLTGCTTEYDRKDIRSYVQEELGKGKYTISDTYAESTGEDGYTDRVWTVVDEKKDITFHVVDDYHWGAESMTNVLKNDYEDAVFLKYQDQLPESPLVNEGRITITAEEDACGVGSVSMDVRYADREELQEILDQLAEYNEFFQNLGFHEVDTYITIQYEGPESFPCKGNMIGGTTYAHLNSDMDHVFEESLQAYILVGLDYRLEEVLSDTTEEEQQEAIMEPDTNRVGIVRENGETEYYDDLIANGYGYGLSVSTLYQILEREGLGPVGDQKHFTWTGADGITYEFSCDYVTELIDGKECAYYLADGVPAKLGFAYNIHMAARAASDLFGISIETNWNQEIN